VFDRKGGAKAEPGRSTTWGEKEKKEEHTKEKVGEPTRKTVSPSAPPPVRWELDWGVVESHKKGKNGRVKK